MNIISSYNSTVILICLLYVIIIGLVTARKVSADSSLYFFTGKKTSWKMLSLSLFSINFPGEYFLVLVILSFSFWWAAMPYEAVCFSLLVITMYCLFPLLMEEKITVSQSKLEIRFGRKAKLILSSISIAAGTFFRLSLILVTAGVLLYDIVGWNYTTFILLMILAAGIYSVAGGMISIVNLQAFQFIIIIVSILLIAATGAGEGFSELTSSAAVNLSLNMEYKPLLNINWIEVLVFIPVFILWYYYNELGVAQKISAADDNHVFAKASNISRIIKLMPVVLFIAIGISTRSYSPEGRIENVMSSFLENEAIGTGVRVFILFTISSAIILALSSIFVSASTQITKDFLEPVYGTSNGHKLVLFSRFFISVLVIITIFLVPFADLRSLSSYISLIKFQMYAAAPLAAVYAAIIGTKKIKSAGIITGLVAGEILALFKILADIYVKPGISADMSVWLADIPAIRVALYIFFISVITIITVSRLKTVSILQLNNLFRKV